MIGLLVNYLCLQRQSGYSDTLAWSQGCHCKRGRLYKVQTALPVCPSVPVGLCRLLPLLDDDGHRGGRGEHGGRGGGGHDRRGGELSGLAHELGNHLRLLGLADHLKRDTNLWLSDELGLLMDKTYIRY